MLRPNATVHVYLYPDPVDIRKSIAGLSALIETGVGFSTLCPYCQKIRNSKHSNWSTKWRDFFVFIGGYFSVREHSVHIYSTQRFLKKLSLSHNCHISFICLSYIKVNLRCVLTTCCRIVATRIYNFRRSTK